MDRTATARQRRHRDKKRDKTRSVTPQTVTVDVTQAAKLLMICKALDKDIHGLDGKVNLLSMIRYGVYGPTLESVKAQLDAT